MYNKKLISTPHSCFQLPALICEVPECTQLYVASESIPIPIPIPIAAEWWEHVLMWCARMNKIRHYNQYSHSNHIIRISRQHCSVCKCCPEQQFRPINFFAYPSSTSFFPLIAFPPVWRIPVIDSKTIALQRVDISISWRSDLYAGPLHSIKGPTSFPPLLPSPSPSP